MCVGGYECGCVWRRRVYVHAHIHHKAKVIELMAFCRVSIAPSPPADNCQHCTFHIWS